MAITYKVMKIGRGWESKTVKTFTSAVKLMEKWRQEPGIKKVGIWRKEYGTSELITEHVNGDLNE